MSGMGRKSRQKDSLMVPVESYAPGVQLKDEMIAVADNVSVRVITFTPPSATDSYMPESSSIDRNSLDIVFVAGWISSVSSWQNVLRKITERHRVFYIETREKISSVVKGKAKYSVDVIGQDIVRVISLFNLKPDTFVLIGSSLGATAILDVHHLMEKPLCMVLVGPNAVFRVPRIWKAIIIPLWPRLFLLIKPLVKWYLKQFRLDVESDKKQFEKYCQALDSADPWKLRKAVMALWNYEVWPRLKHILTPTLIVSASKDKLHEPEHLKKMAALLKTAEYVDLETNEATHSAAMVKAMEDFIEKLIH
jgi:pimeloyl-ACP methyl ester carboxylesterase